MNAYKNLIVLSDRDATSLVKQLKEITLPFSIVSMYGLNGRHFAYLLMDRPVKVEPKKKAYKRKNKSVEELNNKLKEGK